MICLLGLRLWVLSYWPDQCRRTFSLFIPVMENVHWHIVPIATEISRMVRLRRRAPSSEKISWWLKVSFLIVLTFGSMKTAHTDSSDSKKKLKSYVAWQANHRHEYLSVLRCRSVCLFQIHVFQASPPMCETRASDCFFEIDCRSLLKIKYFVASKWTNA